MRLAVFDFETTQDTVVKNGISLHEVNFVSLRWTCTSCAEFGLLDESKCTVCRPSANGQQQPDQGFLRSRSWSWYNCADPIAELMDFLLVAWPAKHRTILWAHNGGRLNYLFFKQITFVLKIR